MLDTDTSSYILKNRHRAVGDRFVIGSGRIVASQIVIAELRYGAENHPTKKDEIHQMLDELMMRVILKDWAASRQYGELRAYLKKTRKPIGNLDLLIAAHALDLNSTLVSNNTDTKHFQFVPNLLIENWVGV